MAAYALIGADMMLLLLTAGMPHFLLEQLPHLPWPMLGLVLLGLTLSAGYGSKASQIRKKYNIRMPHY